MWTQKPSFRFKLDNISEKEIGISSKTFVSGGCEWLLKVYPKGRSLSDDDMSVFLYVSHPDSLHIGWKRRARYYFSVLNQFDEEIYRSSILTAMFSASNRSFRKTLPLSKYQEQGCLENDRLIIEVYINVVEADDGEGEDALEKKETVDIKGFQAFASHVKSVKKTFTEHVAKKDYMNVISNACSKVTGLAEEGFKMEWLKSKLDELSLKMKKSDVDGSQIQELEERIKNLEMMASGVRLDSLESKLGEESLERKKADDADRSRFRKLEENVKTLEMVKVRVRLSSLESRLEEVSLERKHSDDVDESRFGKLEENVKRLEMIGRVRLDSLESRLEDVSLERKHSYDADESLFAKLEQMSLEMINSGLRLESLEARLLRLETSLKSHELMNARGRLEHLESKLEKLSLETKHLDDVNESRFEESLKCLEMMHSEVTLESLESKLRMDSLESKLCEVYLERKKVNDADGSRFQSLEESLKSLEMMVSDLKAELDEEKFKSSSDSEFFLVDKAA